LTAVLAPEMVLGVLVTIRALAEEGQDVHPRHEPGGREFLC
jgi:hypothetical protein